MAREKSVYLIGARGRGTFSGDNAKVGFGKYGGILGGTDCIWVHDWRNGYTIRGNWSSPNICEGVITYPGAWERERYEGRSRDGVPEGYGVMYYRNGDIYKGNWRFDDDHISAPDGEGVYIFEDGEMLSGHWDHNKKNGLCILETSSKEIEDKRDRYVGDVVNGVRNGTGRFCYAYGDIYHGGWENGQISGAGKYVFANGAVLEGCWKNGEVNGLGKETKPSGTFFEGVFENSSFLEGHGRIAFSDGCVYEGPLVKCEDGIVKQDGEGKNILADGTVIEGRWDHGVMLDRDVRMTFTNGVIYEGDSYANGAFNGNAKIVVPDQYTYEGEVRNTHITGKGRMTLQSGVIYDCEWKDGKKDGSGKMITPNGTTLEAVWKDDLMQEEFVRIFAPSGKLVYEGNYYAGQQNGRGKAWLEGGEVYEGEFKDNAINGHGRIRMDSNTVFEGEFTNGRISFDHFRFELADGAVFEGNEENGKLNGTIHFVLSDGGVIDGELSDGEITENSTLTRDGETRKAVWKDGQWAFETEKSFIVLHFENMTPVVEELTKEMRDFQTEVTEAIRTDGKYLTVSPTDNAGYSEELRPYFDGLVGMDAVKSQIDKIYKRFKLDAMRQEMLGINTRKQGYYFIMSGNPGTGKTTVARILAKIYTQLGLLKRDDIFVECTRGDLVGEYQGHTAVKVREKVREALGGVLFIDEAYSLRIDNHDSFGLEAVNALITEIENNRDKLAVIFAGYTKEMEDFLATNPGLKSRMARTIEFTDYSAEELTEIFFFNMGKRGYTVSADKAFVTNYIDARSHTRDFGNARGVRNLCDDVLRNMKARLIETDDLSKLTNEQLKEVLPEDFR